MRDLNAADESWEILQQFLPANLEDSAREHGAFRRARGEIQSAEVLFCQRQLFFTLSDN
jgi:hypothetical protein